MTNYYLILLGIAGGVLSGLLGIGGGTIIVPALLFLFHFEMKQAVGTSLVFIAFASLIGVIGHYQAHNINWKYGSFMALGAILGVVIGVRLNLVLPNLLLKRLFGGFLLIVAIKMIAAP
jgi:uncharacterized membrane protein YfcA